ncbi:MAG: hypothetical protein KJZ86_26755, partial [Caldilineaceae bacterium]|nr:hypothetical protein [Caldilineaceae bacterium]
ADDADFRRLNPCESVLSVSIRVLFSEQATRLADTDRDENRNADFADDADFRRLNPCESVLSVSIRVLFSHHTQIKSVQIRFFRVHPRSIFQGKRYTCACGQAFWNAPFPLPLWG